MKRFLTLSFIGLAILIGAYSCKDSQLEEITKPQPETRGITGEGIVLGSVTKDNEFVKVPFKISLSGTATEAFQVGLTLNNDTVTQLINNGTLTNTILMPSASVEYPNVINVAYGTDTGEGIATVRLATLERFFNQKLAFALKLSQPGKGNKVVPTKSNILVVINPADLFKATDIHYLSLAGGGIYNVGFGSNYSVGPAGVTIPLVVNLDNQPSSAFNINIKENIDTIATLVGSGVLPADAIHLKENEYTIDTLIRFGTGASSAIVRLSIPWPVFDANIAANKKFAFALSLAKNTNHVLHPTKSKLIVVINPNVNLDNNSYITGNGTGLRAKYYRDNQLADFDGRAPTRERIDESINFSGDSWPDGAGVSRDNFSVKWTGEFLAPVRGDYTFYQTRWDDGSRLFINGVAVIDDYTTQWDKDYRKFTIRLERGVKYKIEAHHRENVGGQQAYLEIEVPNVLSKRVIPKSQLFPAP